MNTFTPNDYRMFLRDATGKAAFDAQLAQFGHDIHNVTEIRVYGPDDNHEHGLVTEVDVLARDERDQPYLVWPDTNERITNDDYMKAYKPCEASGCVGGWVVESESYDEVLESTTSDTRPCGVCHGSATVPTRPEPVLARTTHVHPVVMTW